MSIIIAGERSGVGKTTITLALLAYLRQHKFQVQSFKVGPDYIDPMFHQYVTGHACRNLDSVLTSPAYVQTCFDHHTQTADYALVEGVMGLFDGATTEIGEQKESSCRDSALGSPDAHHTNSSNRSVEGFGSTAHIARLLDLPILLVVDCSRISQSIAALVHGYRSFDPDLKFAGLVLNRVGSDRHLHLLKTALAPLDIPILGVLRRQDSITIPDRHLGLFPTAELPHLDVLINQLADLAATAFDWQTLMPLLQVDRRVEETPPPPPIHLSTPSSLRLAIAQDAAFSFYYADNLDLLQSLGAELVHWSPLQDASLPEDLHGLIFGGGFPEVFAAQLATNEAARVAVKTAIAAGMPTYAECGGLMYLCQQIVDFAEQSWDMVGVLPATAIMGKRLTLGYRRVEADQDGVMFAAGAIAWGHEFHRSHLMPDPKSNRFEITTGAGTCPNLYASYVHVHWGATPEQPKRFLTQCHNFKLRIAG